MICTDSVSLFKAAVWQASRETQFNFQKIDSEIWKKAWDNIDQEVQDASYKAAEAAEYFFQQNGVSITIRKRPKNLERIKEKQREELTGKHNYYRPIADFTAARVTCQVPEILKTLDKIKEIIEKFNDKDAQKG